MKTNIKQSLLWELNNGSGSSSYVFGTMHIRDYRAFVYQDIITSYIDRCKIFATEFDLRERDSLKSADISAMPDGESLLTLLGDRKYNRLKKMIHKSFKIDLNVVNNVLPLFTINMLTERILTRSKTVPLDTFLWQYAENIQRDLRGVETFQEQLVTLSKIPLKYQVKSLVEVGKNPDKFRKQILALINQYTRGDIKGLYKKSKKSLGKQRKLLLYDRNIIMAQRIKLLMKESTSFVAIGAGHLSGPKGVLRLLKKSGIRIKPVQVDF